MYQLLDHPLVYRLAQFIFAPGGTHFFDNHINEIAKKIPNMGLTLDIGCGPKSYLWQAGVFPYGCDISVPYVQQFNIMDSKGVVGSVDNLPFCAEAFDTTWCIGVLHHLDDAIAQRAVSEMYRLTKVGGQVIIIDSVLPVVKWRRPFAWCIRKLDRGRFVRTENSLQKIINSTPSKWQISKQSYSIYGLECSTFVASK